MPERESHENWIQGVVARYERPLCQYAYSILKNPDTAREVVQDTLLKLCREVSRKGRPKIPAWLFRVCRNRALDVIRKEKRVNTLSAEKEATLQSPGQTPDQAAAVHDDASFVLRMLGELPSNQQEVIRLKFQQGMSYRQIADVTHLSQSNVGYLIHTGIKTLRQELLAHQGA